MADTPVVLVAIDEKCGCYICMPQRLDNDLGVDAFIQPGLGRAVAKRMQVMLADDVCLHGEPVDQLPDAVGGQRLAVHIEPEGVWCMDGRSFRYAANSLQTGIAQKDLAPAAFTKTQAMPRRKSSLDSVMLTNSPARNPGGSHQRDDGEIAWA